MSEPSPDKANCAAATYRDVDRLSTMVSGSPVSSARSGSKGAATSELPERVHEVPGGVARIAAPTHDHPAILGIDERLHDHLRVAEVVVGGISGRVENGTPARQHIRPAMRTLARVHVERRDRFGAAPGCVDTKERRIAGRCEDDGVRGFPAAASSAGRIADDAGRAAIERHGLQLAFGEEPDRGAVRREERIRPAIRPRQPRRVQAVEAANVESGRAFDRRGIDQPSAVRGQRQGRSSILADDRVCHDRNDGAHRLEVGGGRRRSARRREPRDRRDGDCAECNPGSRSPVDGRRALRSDLGHRRIRPPADPSQHRREVGRGLPPILRITLEAAPNRPVEIGRVSRLYVANREWLAGQDTSDDRGAVRPLEGSPPGRHFIQDQPAREQIGPGITLLSLDLFRRHVLQGSHHLPDMRHRAIGHGVPLEERRPQSGQAEVQQFRAALGQHDVGGLHVPVDDAGGMGMLEAADDFDAADEELVEGNGTSRESRRKRFTVEVLHDDEVQAAFGSDVMDRTDVGMAERGNRTRLALEPRSRLFIVAEGGGQDLDRDGTGQPRVTGAVDLAHSAPADQ